MSAIDYMQLLREEKQKQRKLQNNRKNADDERTASQNTEKDDNDDSNQSNESTSISWSYPNEQLIFIADDNDQQWENSYKVICNDPKRILYASQVFQNPFGITNLQDWLRNIPEGESGINCWKRMKFGKRLVAMFGENPYGVLPLPLQEIANQLVVKGVFDEAEPPNHVLLNAYEATQGILPHTDGPSYKSRTATISLGSDVLLKFTKRLSTNEIGVVNNNGNSGNKEAMTSSPPFNSCMEVLLQNGSMIVFEDDAYLNCCHEIEMNVSQDITTTRCLNAEAGIVVPRQHRFSLTFRHKPAKVA